MPLPTEKLYKSILIEKVELLIQRMRWWKGHLYENSGLNTSNPSNYIFKSRKWPPEHKDLMQFENELLELVKGVKFKKVKNTACTKTNHLFRNLKMLLLLQTKLGIFLKQIKTVNC